MDLILWRHADARDLPEGDFNAELDLQRPLTPRGVKQAARMAEWLNRFLPETTRVLASPALRSCQTADALGRKYRTVESLAPGATHTQALAAARWPEAKEPVLLVGHQPMLGQLAAYLMGGSGTLDLPAWSIKKGAAWWLRHRERGGMGEVVLVSVRAPDSI